MPKPCGRGKTRDPHRRLLYSWKIYSIYERSQVDLECHLRVTVGTTEIEVQRFDILLQFRKEPIAGGETPNEEDGLATVSPLV